MESIQYLHILKCLRKAETLQLIFIVVDISSVLVDVMGHVTSMSHVTDIL